MATKYTVHYGHQRIPIRFESLALRNGIKEDDTETLHAFEAALDAHELDEGPLTKAIIERIAVKVTSHLTASGPSGPRDPPPYSPTPSLSDFIKRNKKP